MYACSVAFVRRVDHSSVILSCNLIGQRENKSFYVTEIVLRFGYADVIFRPRESRQPEIRLRSQVDQTVFFFKQWNRGESRWVGPSEVAKSGSEEELKTEVYFAKP